MKEKLLKLTMKLTKLAASVALAIAGGAFLSVLILPFPQPPENGRAMFESWEATQTRQDGRGAAQSGEVAPWPCALRKPFSGLPKDAPLVFPPARLALGL